MVDRNLIPSTSMLLAFEAAIRFGNYTRAAREIGVTQAAVSRQMKQLETFVGVPLFEQNGRNVRATSAAAHYYSSIKRGLDEIAAGTHHLMHDGGTHTIRIALLPFTSSRWFAPRLPEFMSQNPNVEIVLSNRDRRFEFAREHFDGAVYCGEDDWDGVVSEVLGREIMVPVCAPSILKEVPIEHKADLLKHTLITTYGRATDWQSYLADCKVSLSGLRKLQFESYRSTVKAAISGLGIAIVPLLFTTKELRTGELVLAHGAPYPSGDDYFFVYPGSRLKNPAFEAIRDWITGVAKQAENPITATGIPDAGRNKTERQFEVTD